MYGRFIKKTQHQENMWLTKKQLQEDKTLDLFPDLNLSFKLKPNKISFDEVKSSDSGEY